MNYSHIDPSGMKWRFEGGRPISALADKVMADVERDTLLTSNSPNVKPLDGNLTGKILVLNAKRLKPEQRKRSNQLWHADSGFGCVPGLAGTAIYATCQADGEKARWSLGDFIGIFKA